MGQENRIIRDAGLPVISAICAIARKRVRTVHILIVLLMVQSAPGLVHSARALDYPPGFKFVQVPNPLAERNPAHPLPEMNRPVMGEPFFDQQFRTILTRVTDRGKIRHEYSRFDPFNADQSLITLQDVDSGEFMVFRTQGPNYADERNLVARIGLEEPRWDPADPYRLWGFDGFKIATLDVKTGKTNVVKDFAEDPALKNIIKAEPDLYRITTKNEGEPSFDFRYWVLALQGSKDDYRIRRLICWDREKDKILGNMPISAGDAGLIDWVGASPLGNWALIGGDSDGGRKTSGLNILDRGFSKSHRLAVSTAHSDVGLDVQGREVLVMQNSTTDYIDLIPLDPGVSPVASSENYAGGIIRPLVRLFYSSDDPEGFSGGVHISCNTPGYCVISTYNSPDEPERNWLDRTIIFVKLDPDQPRCWYLAKVHNTTKAYWEETHASISRDGSRIVWASNWGENAGREIVFVMQLTMPPGWRTLLK